MFLRSIALAVLAFTTTSAFAQSRSQAMASDPTQSRPLGIGVMAGEPTGITAKYWLNEVSAIDAGAAWTFEGENSFSLHGDYLLHDHELFSVDGRPLQFYFGGGLRFKFEEKNTRFGVRIPVGLAFAFDEEPIDVNVELAPVVDLAPDTDLFLNASVGARYYF